MSVNVYDVLSIWTNFLKERIDILAARVKVADSFEFENSPSVAQKDAYFGAINEDGRMLLHCRQYFMADEFYGSLLAELKSMIRARQNESPDFNLNKGMIYVNYGISQLRSGKTDEGIAHILTAFDEDELYKPVITDSPLYAQFEKQSYIWLFQQISSYHTDLQQVNLDNEDFGFVQLMINAWSKLPGQHTLERRLILLGTLHHLKTSVGLLKERELDYTKGRLSLYLREICTFIESVLRDKAIDRNWEGVTASDPQLGGLLRKREMPNEFVCGYVSNGMGSTTENNTFSDRISTILALDEKTTEKAVAKALVMTLLVRNYSSHNFYVGDMELFDNLDNIMPLLLFATVYMVMDF